MIVESFLILLFMLIAGHALADYPLQSEFMAIGKNNRMTTHNGVPWYYCLGSHCLVHGAVVWAVTGLWSLAAAETVLHWIIDDAKCRKLTNIHTDQFLHILCKVAFALTIVYTDHFQHAGLWPLAV